MNWRSIRALELAMTIGLAATTAQAGTLFTPLDDEALRAKAMVSDPAFRALADDPATTALRLVQASPEAVQRDEAILDLSLGAGLELRAERINSYRLESGSRFWFGTLTEPRMKGLAPNPINTLALIENEGKLTANLHWEGQLFELRPLKDGGHALATIDTSRFPPEEPAESRLPVVPMPKNPAGLDVNTVITVLVNYTPAASSASGDINGLIDLAVAESNQGYTNSGVGITLQLVKKAQTTYTENSSFDTDLSRYLGTGDGYMDYIHTQRTQFGADVAVLLTTNPQYCGLASGIGSSATTAFVAVLWSCATGYYSFAHEIGHLQSARHDPANDPTNSPYAYGHGYQYNGSPKWRTIMAYDCPGGCTRLDYWSNPNVLYNGLPMGTAGSNDNARVLNNTKATVAGFKSAPSCIPDGGADDTLSVTSCCSGVAVNGTTYCTNPADWGTTWASCHHICGSALTGGCVPSGGVDDVFSSTSCCSGAAVPGSTFCLDPADYGTDWQTCAQICA